MKKLIVFITMALVLCFGTALAKDGVIHTIKFWNAEAVANGGTTYEDFNLNTWKPTGYFSLQVTVTGDGTAQLTYFVSNDGVTWRTPSTASDIVTAHIKTTGSSGTEFYDLSSDIEFCRHLRIVVTETGAGADAIAITATLSVQ